MGGRDLTHHGTFAVLFIARDKPVGTLHIESNIDLPIH